MNILFTGGSSFTGYWFIKELVKKGHEVYTTFTNDSAISYTGIRRQRVDEVAKISNSFFGIKFGDDKFIKLIDSSKKWDLYCHHASYVKDYKEPGFDLLYALKENTNNISASLDLLKAKGCRDIIFTGSYFENDEGRNNNEPPEAFSLYGLSKNLSYQIFRFYCHRKELNLGKFVIPNPFGAFEEARFTTYLVNSWLKKTTPDIKSPDYIRDNIPVTLLAKCYIYFIEKIYKENLPYQKINPGCYVETQSEFTKRFALKMKKYLQIETPFNCLIQSDFSEPMNRSNTLNALEIIKDWDEEEFWKDLASYYKNSIH